MRRSKVVVFVIMFFFSACGGPEEHGTLQGYVTIGPLVPVVREGELEPTPAPEVYAARKIVIYDEDGGKEIIQVDIDGEGNYVVELPVGVYTVDINRLGIDSGLDLPTRIEIMADQVVVLDIDIDTGIR